MFKPDNDKLKSVIFHLLKKEPMVNISTPTWKYGNKEVSIGYPFHPYVPEKGNYVVNENKLYDIFINSNFCSTNAYGLNSYFFAKSNEFIFSCVDDLNHFYNCCSRLDYNHICYYFLAMMNEFDYYLYNNCLKLYIGEKLSLNY